MGLFWITPNESYIAGNGWGFADANAINNNLDYIRNQNSSFFGNKTFSGHIEFGTGVFASNRPSAFTTAADGLLLTGKLGTNSDLIIATAGGLEALTVLNSGNLITYNNLTVTGATKFGSGSFISGESRAFTSATEGLIITGFGGSLSHMVLTTSGGTTAQTILSTGETVMGKAVEFGLSAFISGKARAYTSASEGLTFTGFAGSSSNMLFATSGGTTSMTMFSTGNMLFSKDVTVTGIINPTTTTNIGNDLEVTGETFLTLGRVPTFSVHLLRTEDQIFTLLETYVPNINDELVVSGSVANLGSVSYVERTASNTITFYGLNLGVLATHVVVEANVSTANYSFSF